MRAVLVLALVATLGLAGCTTREASTSTTDAPKVGLDHGAPTFWSSLRSAPADASAARRILLNEAGFANGMPSTLATYVHGDVRGDAVLMTPEGWQLVKTSAGWTLKASVIEKVPYTPADGTPRYLALLDLNLTSGMLQDGLYTLQVQCLVDDTPNAYAHPCTQQPDPIQFVIRDGKFA